MDERKVSAQKGGCGRANEKYPAEGNPWASAISIPTGIIARLQHTITSKGIVSLEVSLVLRLFCGADVDCSERVEAFFQHVKSPDQNDRLTTVLSSSLETVSFALVAAATCRERLSSATCSIFLSSFWGPLASAAQTGGKCSTVLTFTSFRSESKLMLHLLSRVFLFVASTAGAGVV